MNYAQRQQLTRDIFPLKDRAFSVLTMHTMHQAVKLSLRCKSGLKRSSFRQGLFSNARQSATSVTHAGDHHTKYAARCGGDPFVNRASDTLHDEDNIPDSSVGSNEILVVCVLAHVAQRSTRTLHELGAREVRRHALED